MSIQVCKGLEADQDPLESWHLCQHPHHLHHTHILSATCLQLFPPNVVNQLYFNTKNFLKSL